MTLVQCDDVIEQIATATADPAFRNTVLPGASYWLSRSWWRRFASTPGISLAAARRSTGLKARVNVPRAMP